MIAENIGGATEKMPLRTQPADANFKPSKLSQKNPDFNCKLTFFTPTCKPY